ncbi:MAG: tetratricopeptide repeat protein [Bacteroidetes bacterium]|nr:MAG: tetratricopeptide repeat protein [Bacteroidota bacterium]
MQLRFSVRYMSVSRVSPNATERNQCRVLHVLFLLMFLMLAEQMAAQSDRSQQAQELLMDAKKQKNAGEYDRAFETISEAVELSRSASEPKLLSRSLGDLGVIRMYQGRYSDALEHFQEAVNICEQLKDTACMAVTYNYFASVHHAQKDYDIAIRYYLRSLELRKGTEDSAALGVLYNNLGTLYADQADLENSLFYHSKSMAIWESLKDTSWIAVSLRHIGYCRELQGNAEEALSSYLRSYDLSLEKGTRMNVIRASMPLGNLYLKMGNPTKAMEWCKRAYLLSMEESNLYGIQESCLCLSEVYDRMHRSAEALDFYRRSIKARDSIYGHERTKELTRLEMNFVFERQQLADSLQFVKEQMAKEKQIQNQRIGWASTGFVLLMIGALALVIYRGKRKSDHLLLNILPRKIADELKAYGVAKPNRLENVTVIFTDFCGFTALSEKLTPEELVSEIDRCFRHFDHIMDEFGVEKIKTIGDAYMAAAGVPTPKHTHAIDAVRTALKMQEFMLSRERDLKAEGKPFFRMRIGIHSGTVVAGIVGEKKFQYDIWGDTVNVASRMEQSGEPGRVNISKETYELVRNEVVCSYRGKIAAKGKGEVDMYFVESDSQAE